MKKKAMTKEISILCKEKNGKIKLGTLQEVTWQRKEV